MRKGTKIALVTVGLAACCGGGGTLAVAGLSGIAESAPETFAPTLAPDKTTTPNPGTRPKVNTAPTIESGTWTISVDVPAGTYKLNQPQDGPCYWGIYKSGTNLESIITNDIVDGGRPSVTLKKGHDFKSDCGTWTKTK